MFASPADLAVFLQTATEDEFTAGNPDVLDTQVAILALESATADIQGVCGWSIAQETVTGQTYDLERRLTLPTLNLTALSISRDGTPLISTGYTWYSSGAVEIYPTSGVWAINSTNNGYAPIKVAVTYTHGYATIPAGVRAVCLERAALNYVNPTGDLSHTRNTMVTVYARSGEGSGSSLALVNDGRLAPFKLPGVA